MSSPPGSLLVVSGPPGAGKSTVARAVADRLDPGVLVEGDAFFAFLHRGAIEPWLPASRAQNETVTLAAGAAAGAYVAGGYAVVYDGVVGPWFLPTFLAGTGLAHLDVVVLLPSLATCLERVATRVGHGFTDADATAHMHAEFTRAAGGVAGAGAGAGDGPGGAPAPIAVLTDEAERSVDDLAELVLAGARAGRFHYPARPGLEEPRSLVAEGGGQASAGSDSVGSIVAVPPPAEHAP